MPLYTFTDGYRTIEILNADEYEAAIEAGKKLKAKNVERVYTAPAGVVFKKTGTDRGATRKSTWRKATK